MHAALDNALDDSWTLFKGYRNRAGEIDYLLIGPTGLFAIEVKARQRGVPDHPGAVAVPAVRRLRQRGR